MMVSHVFFCILLLNLTFSFTQSMKSYCKFYHKHPFCKNNCLGPPKICPGHRQISISLSNIKDMTKELNKIRMEAVMGNLSYYYSKQVRFKYAYRRMTIERAFSLNQIVSNCMI